MRLSPSFEGKHYFSQVRQTIGQKSLIPTESKDISKNDTFIKSPDSSTLPAPQVHFSGRKTDKVIYKTLGGVQEVVGAVAKGFATAALTTYTGNMKRSEAIYDSGMRLLDESDKRKSKRHHSSRSQR